LRGHGERRRSVPHHGLENNLIMPRFLRAFMNKKYIEIVDVLSLRGPNIWTYPPVLEAWVDIGDLEDFPSNLIPGFAQRLESWLPLLIEHRCSYEERGGFLRRLREGTWPAHILEHVTLELQNLSGLPGGFGKAREVSSSRRGLYRVVVSAWQEEATRAALFAARDLVMAAIEDRPFDVTATIGELHDLVQRHYFGPSTAAIVHAAQERLVPAIRLSEGHNLVQLGYGSRQRRIWTAESDRTGAIAESISRDKHLTRELLQSCGLPVPEGAIVANPEQAWQVAQEMGLPVVIKPSDGNHGRGVFTDLRTREEIETAFAVACEEGSDVIVERFIPGLEHRLLVVGNKLAAAAKGMEAWVTGDGVSTIETLVQTQLNSDPRRGRSEYHPLNPVRLDSAARLEIARQGFQPDSVAPAGTRVLIQRNGNVAFDVTDQVHPRIAEQVCLAARVIGLDIAGIDLVACDISRPLEEQGGALVEINAGPGLLMHLRPAEGQARPVGEAIAQHLFPGGDRGRIPIVGVAGSHGKTAVARLVAHLLQLSGVRVGLACSTGLYMDGRALERGDAAHWAPAQRVLRQPTVDAAVFENGNRMILTEGLAYDRCQVGVVTDLDPALTFPALYIETPEQLSTVVRTQVDVVLPEGVAVLNGADDAVVALAKLCDGEIMLFGEDAGLPAIASHLSRDGRAVVVVDDWIVLAQGQTQTRLLPVIAVAQDARLTRSLAQTLAAVGAGWALGLSPAILRAGLETQGASHPALVTSP
jgi:cyanophycin synthetase